MRKIITCSFFIFCFSSVFSQDKFAIYFDFNKFDLNATSKKRLDSLLATRKNIQITKILGFSDATDSNVYNDTLSVRRAKSVNAYFVKAQVPFDKKFVVNGVGENFDQHKNQKFNRKVEVYFQKIITARKAPGSENSNFIPDDSNNNFDVNASIQHIADKIAVANVNDVIILENLNFQFNSEKLIPESQAILNYLLETLQNNPKLKVDIIGHICCNKDTNNITLSSRRAKFVFDYLIKNGIPVLRLGYRGFGSSRPIYKIPEQSYAEEFANRRVEILIKQI